MALTGFLIKGGCYDTSVKALVALQAEFPQIVGTLLVNSPSGTFAAPNTFALTLKTTAINAGTTATGVKTMVIPMCDPAIPIAAGLTPFDPVAAAAFWMWGMTMVLGVYLVANNSGAVLRFIQGRNN